MTLDLLTANDQPGQYPASYYAATKNINGSFVDLKGAHNADVCIIGGGYTGLSAALHLAKAGRRVVLLEANKVGWGASGRNGGQVGSGQRRDQDELEKIVGNEHARRLWDLAEQAKAQVRSLVSEYDIACDLKSGVIHADHRKSRQAHSKAYAEKLQTNYDYDAIRYVDQGEMRQMVGSAGYFSGTYDTGAGHLHPLNYAIGLAKAASKNGAEIFENSRVTSIDETGGKSIIATEHGSIKADHCLFACNGYLGELGGNLTVSNRRRVMAINNFIIATEPLSDDRAMGLISNGAAVADSRFVVNYFRLVVDPTSGKKRLLFGGGENYAYRFPRDIKAFVRKPMLQVYPNMADCLIDYGWGGTLAITVPRMPAFQRLSPTVYAASGYSGHGVAMATLGGKIMSEAILGDSSAFDVFAKLPSQNFPGGVTARWPLLVLAMSYYALRDRL